MKKNIIYFLLFSVFFGLQAKVEATTDYFIRTDAVQNIGSKEVKIFGSTSSSTPPSSTAQVYFEYGLNIANLSSSTPPKNVPSLDLNDVKNSIFSETVTDVVPGIWNYFRAVRKTSYTNPVRVEIENGSVQQIMPAFENNAPQIIALVPFNGSACDDDDCVVTIPENFSRSIPVATIYTRDADRSQSFELSIKSGNTGNAFYINPFGDLKVNDADAIDYEEIHSFNLEIEVKDNGFPQKTDSVDLRVNITNVDPEDGTEASYPTNTRNASYVTYGNVGGANNVSYIRFSDRPTYRTTSSGGSSYADYNYSDNSNSGYNNYNNTGSSYGFGTNGGSTYGVGQNQNSTNSQNYNNGNTNNASQEEIRQALIRAIMAQIALLQAELNERIRLGLP